MARLAVVLLGALALWGWREQAATVILSADARVRARLGLRPTAPVAPPAPVPASAPTPHAAASRPRAGMRLVRGLVFDAVTLEPVAFAKLSFAGGRESPHETQARPDGRYELELPLHGEYTASASAPDYRPGQLVLARARLENLSREERESVAEQASDADLAPLLPDWGPRDGKATLDFPVLRSR